jgi:hypothetical protein
MKAEAGVACESLNQSALDRLLTLREIQSIANVSRGTVWRWRREHGLRIIRVAGVTRIRESDWLTWLAKHSETELSGQT